MIAINTGKVAERIKKRVGSNLYTTVKASFCRYTNIIFKGEEEIPIAPLVMTSSSGSKINEIIVMRAF